MTPKLAAALFIVAQLLDGILTYAGIKYFGPEVESNPLLAGWIALIGAAPALIGAKLLASACGLLLFMCGVHRILLTLTIFYGVVAIGPWLSLFMMF